LSGPASDARAAEQARPDLAAVYEEHLRKELEHRDVDATGRPHDVEMDAILPGVAPTGRPVELPFVVVMGFDADGKVSNTLMTTAR